MSSVFSECYRVAPDVCRLTRSRAAITLCFLLTLLVTSAPTGVHADSVTVFAAASLKNTLDEVSEAFTRRTGARARISYAGSSALARQIQGGAPADVFISADTAWMDVLESSGLIDSTTRIDLLGNSLVLIAHATRLPDRRRDEHRLRGVQADDGRSNADREQAVQSHHRPFDLSAALGEERLALALVDAVPAGRYARSALESLGLWHEVESRIVQTDNVRATLALVAREAVPLGIVYATDAQAESRVQVLWSIPSEAHPRIVYPMAQLRGRASHRSRQFLDFLRSPEARQYFEAHGFSTRVNGSSTATHRTPDMDRHLEPEVQP